MTTTLMTVADVAGALKVSDRTVQRLLADGEIESVVIAGRSRRVHPEAVDAYVARCAAHTQQAAREPTAPVDALQRSARSPHRRGLRAAV